MIGNRLKLARDASGLSLRDLEASINKMVSAQAIGKYERNEMMPSSSVLMALSKELEVSVEYLLSTNEIELTGIDFRKAPQTSAKEERTVEAKVLEQVEQYLELEDLIPGVSMDWCGFDDKVFQINSIESAEDAAEALRSRWNLGIDPIPHMAELLEEKGVKVLAFSLPEKVSGSKALVKRKHKSEVPVIVVNEVHNGERQRFTLAHELAHMVLRFVGMSEQDQEKAADRFAGAFLVAKEMLRSLVGENRNMISLGELADLKKVFKVSISSLVVRCSQLGILARTSYGKLWGQIKQLGWNDINSDEPNKLDPEIPERKERLCLRAVSERIISNSKAAELMQWTVLELEERLTMRAA